MVLTAEAIRQYYGPSRIALSQAIIFQFILVVKNKMLFRRTISKALWASSKFVEYIILHMCEF